MSNTLRFDHVSPPDDLVAFDASADAVVLVPVKAFARAKERLSPALDDHTRAELARAMADVVVTAAAPLPVAVVCDDDDVARWASGHGAQIIWTPGLGLNGAVQAATEQVAAAGIGRAVVVHADLPFAAELSGYADLGSDVVALTPDRRRDGTNVVSVPTRSGFRFAYGAGSFDAHCAEAERCGLVVVTVEAEHLAWDVDRPDDLTPPDHLGQLPLPGVSR